MSTVAPLPARRRAALPRPVKVGLVAAAAGIYLSMVGIIGRFDERPVIAGVITLGRTLLFLVTVGAGYLAASRIHRREGASSAMAISWGAVAGAVAGLGLGLLGILIDVVPARSIFPALGSSLGERLSLGQEPLIGALWRLGSGAALGAAGAGLAVLPGRIRGPLMTGLVSVLGMSLAEPLLGVVLEGLDLETQWLFEAGGLSVSGAIIVFVVATGIALFRAERGDIVGERLRAMPTGGQRALRVSGLLVAIAVLAVLPIVGGGFVSLVLSLVGLYVLLGLGLNIVVGYAGLLDLGYVAFFAVGAYTTAVLTSRESFVVTDEGTKFAESGLLNFWAALPVMVVVAIIIGVMIGAPVLRLRGDYLAIVTLGFGEIVRTLVISDWLEPWLGGAQGIIQIPGPPPEALDLRDPERLYYLIFAFVLLAAYVSYRLAGSRVGRAWAAMREDESVAEAMGISVIKYKLLAFAMGAAIGSLGGAFFATLLGSIFPASFALQVSINVLAVLVLGGMGSIPGVFIGAFVLVGLPELLREFGEFRLLIFGAVLVAIMILKPEGLLPNVRRRRELHVDEVEEEQYERRIGAEETPAPVVTGGATDREGTT